MTSVLQERLLELMNIAIMLAMGLDLTLAQLKRTVRAARPLIVGVLVNAVALPLAAAALIAALALPPQLALGFLLCAVAAGGPTGPLLTANARGDIAYSVTLVVLLSVLSIGSVPLLLALLAGVTGDAFAAATPRIVATILWFQLLPCAIGMVLRARSPRLAAPLHRIAKALGNLVLAGLTLALLAQSGGDVLAHGPVPLLAMAAFVGLTLAAGRCVAPLGTALGRAAMFTGGIRNLALALLLTARVFGDPQTVMAALSYGLIMFLVCIPAALLAGRRPPVAAP